MQLEAIPAAVPLTPKPAAGPITIPKSGGIAGGASAAAPTSAKLAALVNTPVKNAVDAVTKHLAQVATLTIGGGTKEGAAAAVTASQLLSQSSMAVQVIHRNAVPTQISPELEMNLMGVASGMASAAAQVALMGQASPEPIALKELLAAPTKQALDVLATVADHVGRAQRMDASPSAAGGYL